MRQPSIGISIVVLLAGTTVPALAGTIEGRLWISKQAERSVRALETGDAGRRSGARRRAEVARIERGVTDAVVYVESVPDDVERRRARRPFWSRRPALPRLAVRRQRFVPAVLATTAGAGVRIRNRDRVYHHTFGVSPAGDVDLGARAPGSEDTLTFARPGVVHLFCRLHSEEMAFVVVAPNHAWTRPDSLGRFSLRGLPAGTYRVHVWHPQRGSTAQSVELDRGRALLDVAL